jgi:hypothetical protein
MSKDTQFTKEKIENALLRLSYVGQYKHLMDLFPQGDVSKNGEFQEKYEEFYMLKRKPEEFRKAYFVYMQKQRENKELKFKDVLEHLFTVKQNGKVKVEASFAAKLLHTINPKFPTWDYWIGKNFKIKIPLSNNNNDKARQIEKAIELYDQLIDKFDGYRKSENGKKLLAAFDNAFPGFKNTITDTKKIDLVLWQMRL